jgi:hypothetical protein
MRKLFLLWLGAAILIAIGLAQTNLIAFYKLSREGVLTRGTVTAFEPNDHNALHYTYAVNGGTYEKAGPYGYFLEGQVVPVSYLPDKPYVSCVGPPQELLQNEAGVVLVASIVLPACFLGVGSWRSPSFRNWLLH